MSTIDTVRALFTYAIALVVVAGGGAMLYATIGVAGAEDFRVVIAGFMGAAITFVFSQETQTRTARQAATAHSQGAILHANGFTGTAPARTAPET